MWSRNYTKELKPAGLTAGFLFLSGLNKSVFLVARKIFISTSQARYGFYVFLLTSRMQRVRIGAGCGMFCRNKAQKEDNHECKCKENHS